MTTANQTTRPTHRVFAVTKKTDADKARWTEIGAACPHKDGKALSLKLEFMPLGDADIVIREAQCVAGGEQ